MYIPTFAGTPGWWSTPSCAIYSSWWRPSHGIVYILAFAGTPGRGLIRGATIYIYIWGYPLPVSTCRRIAQYHLSLICLHSARATWEWWSFPQCYAICRGGVALYLARVARLVKFKILGGRPVLGARGTAGKFLKTLQVCLKYLVGD